MALSTIVLLSGCITSPSNPNLHGRATDIPAKQATPDYWYNKPGVVTVRDDDFDALWNAAAVTARDYGFWLDRTDYRGGLLTTQPMTSKQLWEFWRDDAGSFEEVEQSSLDSISRSVHFEFEKLDDGSFQMTPKVLVERYSTVGRRITSVVQYRSAFAQPESTTSRETDQGEIVRDHYWYAIGRDEALERKLAKAVEGKLRTKSE